jgi:hypothetical protein
VPKPPARPPADLDEVERAISVLGGRHPEHERTRRETLAAADQRRRVLEAELAQASRRKRRRALVIAANVVAVGVAAFVTWRLLSRAAAIREALAQDEAPFLEHGLSEVASNQLTARRVLEVDAPGTSCFVALATSGRVRVQWAGRSIEGGRSVGWCACEPAHVAIETAETTEARAGLALLRIDARVVGGRLARAWAPFHPDAWGEEEAACAEATLDAWIDDHHWPMPAVDTSALEGIRGTATLHHAGFRIVSIAADDTPFAVVEPQSDQCSLALSGEGAMFLRAPGGARVIAQATGAMVWCASHAPAVSVWRADGSGGKVVVLSAPSERLGGLLGATECARDAGYAIVSSARWLRDEDQGWDAAAILRASAVGGVESGQLAAAPANREVRLGTLVYSPPARPAWDPPTERPSCQPALDPPSGLVESVCAFAAPVSLWRHDEGNVAFARAPVPVWLSTLSSRVEPDAVARIPELLALARELGRDGFEPTVFEGVTELREGVRVVGRAGEDAVVAVGLAPKVPWVFPYTDGVPWDLGDAPRVVPLQPGTAVTLATSPAPDASLDRRRTVVFRRTVRP